MRAETGVMQFRDDWPGVFIRGDRAMNLGMILDAIVAEKAHPIHILQIKGLARLLKSCQADLVEECQHATLQHPAGEPHGN